MALTEQDFEQIESEVWNGYNEHENPLRGMEFLLLMKSNPDSIFFGKKLALIFAETIDYDPSFGFSYISKEDFKECGYKLSKEGELIFEDGSSLIFDEDKQSIKLFDFC